MTREEAIEAIKCNWPDSRYTILREALDMAISALREQDVANKDVEKWISVKDKLPDTYVCVLVHYDDGNMLVDAVGSNGEWMDEDFRCGNITHWMPLPESPEEETL